MQLCQVKLVGNIQISLFLIYLFIYLVYFFYQLLERELKSTVIILNLSVSPTSLSIFASCILKICFYMHIHSVCLLDELTLCQQEMFLFRNIFILKSSLCDYNIAASPFSFLLFIYHFIILLHISYLCLYIQTVSCRQHIIWSSFFSLILIAFNIISNIVGFKFTIILVLYFLIVPFFLR